MAVIKKILYLILLTALMDQMMVKAKAAYSGVSCWDGCGKKGGQCEKMCGSNGYCCRKGFDDCSKALQQVALNEHHSCLTKQDTWTYLPLGRWVNCWNDCGGKGGLCEKVCGSNGYCCRKGFNDCSKGAQQVALNERHSCLTKQGTWTQLQVNCWDGCGKKGGLCEKVCGSSGYCCRKGFNDCSKAAQQVAPVKQHSCVIMS